MAKRVNLPSIEKVFKYWVPWIKEQGHILDTPICLCCGKPMLTEDKYPVKESETIDDFAKLWNKAKLQRCHIVPDALGGSNKPENIFLMCAECHDLAPNTTSRNVFLKWAKNQSWIKRGIAKFSEEMNTFGIFNGDNPHDNKVLEIFKSKEFYDYAMATMGLHFNQAGRGITLTTSSIIGALSEYIKNNV